MLTEVGGKVEDRLDTAGAEAHTAENEIEVPHNNGGEGEKMVFVEKRRGNVFLLCPDLFWRCCFNVGHNTEETGRCFLLFRRHNVHGNIDETKTPDLKDRGTREPLYVVNVNRIY